MYKLLIHTIKKGTIELKFKNFENFVFIAGHQIGILKGYIDDPESYCNEVSKDYSKRFKERETLGVFDNLSSNSKILDIGSGVGILDIILHQYLNGGTFYLLDKDEVNHDHTVAHWSEEHGFYNDWTVLHDILESSNINTNHFKCLNPNEDWPKQLDLINSTYSYLWHYPRTIYWDKIQQHENSSLCFDILNRPENIMHQINQDIGRTCVFKEKPPVLFHWFKKDLYLENGSPGKICYWS